MVKKNLFIFLGLLVLDQITKILVASIDAFIDLKILAINFVTNTGATWGLFQNSNALFIWISFMALGILIWAYDSMPKKGKYFYYLLLTGILGNLMDRIFRGYVVDFIDFKFWPVFNLADIFIVVGIIGLIIFMFKEKD